MKNQMAAKITSGLAGGGGIVALVFALHSDIKTELKVGDNEVRQYVDMKIEKIDTKVDHLSKGQQEMKEMLKVIDKRLYDLKSK